MASVKFYNGFTYSQLNHQVFVPQLINPKLNINTLKFVSKRAEAIAPSFGVPGSHKVVLKGNFSMSGTSLSGPVKSIKLVGPSGKLYEITNIKGVSLWEYIIQTMNLPLNPTALTDLVFAGGISLKMGSGNDVFNGTSGKDVVKGGDGDDDLSGGNGKDFLYGQNGNDSLDGGFGNDFLFGGDGDDFIIDIFGNNLLSGENGNDNIIAGIGNDTISGGNGNDTISAGGGNDKISGGNGNDLIFAGAGNDKINAGKGNDTVLGNDGNDKINGSHGSDLITGGLGSDVLTGGRGADTFIFVSAADSAPGKGNRDVITDFKRGVDLIDLSQIDAGLAAGDQAFTFIGTNDFTGAGGELRFDKVGKKKTIVSGDIDGDGIADFQIQLTGRMGLSVDDFIL